MLTRRSRVLIAVLSITCLSVGLSGEAAADGIGFTVEFEGGRVWQASNNVQIPNSELGTRFSLADLTGSGPSGVGRVYLTWDFSERSGVRVLLAPFSSTETGNFDAPVAFAGATYQPGLLTAATYKFNSWRLTYRYRIKAGDRWKLWFGLTAKVRDAKIELRQGDVTSKDDDVGFVPLLHFAADYRLADRWHLLADIDALAGGPGRAIDLAIKLAYEIGDNWALTAGYRTLEGGADVDDVYNFAWFNYAVMSLRYRF